MSTSKDKKKKLLKRLSKIRRSERKDKKKKRTKNRSSSRNSLYQEYAYQQQNRSSTYLLVLFIVILLAAVGVVVYFFAIKPKLDEEKKKECNIDCGETKYLNKENCECLPCGKPDPTCEPKHYYDTSKCNKDNPKFGCQPCPTDCGPGKRREGCSELNKGECVAIPTQPPSSNDKKKGLTGGAIAGIVFGVIAFFVIVALFLKSRSGGESRGNVKWENTKSNAEKLKKQREQVDHNKFINTLFN